MNQCLSQQRAERLAATGEPHVMVQVADWCLQRREFAMIAAFGVTGALPFAAIAGSSNAYAAQTNGKIKKKHGYSAQTIGKKHSKGKMNKASHQM